LDTDLLVLGVIVVDADEVATEVMFAREGTTARTVRANEWLEAVRIMSSHVGLQIVSSGEGSRARRALVFAAGVAMAIGRHVPVVTHRESESGNWMRDRDGGNG